MKKVETIQAAGHVLCHDITQIIKGIKKGVAFKKGHIVTKEDIPVLLSLGKDHLYIWEKDDSVLHENQAAQILYDICKNDHMCASGVHEGKIELIAEIDGVLKVDTQKLFELNSLGEMMIATRHGNFTVKKGDKLAGTRIIPLLIEKEKMDKAVAIAGSTPLLSILPYQRKKVGLVITGNEVYHQRIKDTFGPVILEKLSEYDVQVLGKTVVYDDTQMIAEAIKKYLDDGAQMIICTGGMSVDPDDLTPSAIKSVGAQIVSYGAPTLPGAMFLLGYYQNSVPIMGLPGCVMYAKRTIFDLVLPRVMAGEKLTKQDLAALGHGGLCLNCEPCTFPNCGFGKGM